MQSRSSVRRFFNSLYGRLCLSVALILFICSIIGGTVWVFAWRYYTDLALQQLHHESAAHILGELAPLLVNDTSVDELALRARLVQLRGMYPPFDYYIATNDGQLRFSDPFIWEDYRIDLEAIRDFLHRKGQLDQPMYLRNPRSSSGMGLAAWVVFSAAEFVLEGEPAYFIVILTGSQVERTFTYLGALHLYQYSFVWILLTFLAAVAFAAVILRLVTKRFNQMTEVVEEYSSGNRDIRINDRNVDEVGILARAFDTLADTVNQSMSALSQRDELRRNLVANISHDIRTPLTRLKGYLQMILEQTREDTTNRAWLQKMEKAVSDLKNLADALFQLSKLEATEQAPDLTPIALDELLDEITESFAPLAHSAQVELRFDAPTETPEVNVDPELLQRALENLLSNAIRHTSSGGWVKVLLECDPQSIRIVVADSGSGIPAADIPLLFERFYQAGTIDGKKGAGGLGLAIVKRIVELHKGQIEVMSEEGHGTSFIITLPLMADF